MYRAEKYISGCSHERQILYNTVDGNSLTHLLSRDQHSGHCCSTSSLSDLKEIVGSMGNKLLTENQRVPQSTLEDWHRNEGVVFCGVGWGGQTNTH